MLGFSLGSSASAPDLTLKEGHNTADISSTTQQLVHGSMHSYGSAMDLATLSPAPPAAVGSENNGVIVGFGGGSGGMGGYNPNAEEKRRSRMRMALEYHTNVLPAEGGVVIPAEALPIDLSNFDMASAICARGRDFVFAGEQIRLVVYISPLDPASGEDQEEESPPAEPARRLFRNSGFRESCGNLTAHDEDPADSSREGWEESASPPDGTLPPGLVKGVGGGLMKDTASQLKRSSGMKRQGLIRRSKLLLESMQRSHFFVKITVPDAPPVRRHSSSSSAGYASKRGSLDTRVTSTLERTASTRSVGQHGCSPLIIEQTDFDARRAGGLARSVADAAILPNGDVVVALYVTIGNESPSTEASLEVLQFERSDPPASSTATGTTPSASPALRSRSPASSNATSPNLSPIGNGGNRSFAASALSNPATGLLQWLLPLDAPPTSPTSLSGPAGGWVSPPRPTPGIPPPVAPIAPQPGGFTFSGGFGSAAHQRQPSSPPRLMGGAPANASATGVALYSLSLGGDEADVANGFRDLPLGWPNTKGAGGGSGNEGLLSFRGAPLEPQRFTTQCGLEGLHVPAKRWIRQLAVLQPLSVESHVSECDTQDLLCVLVTNVLPALGMTKDVVVYVDSLSMECRSTTPGSNPLPTHVASIDVGYDSDFPVALRPGEQHSFVLRPRPAMSIPGVNDKATAGGPSHSRMESSAGLHSAGTSAEVHHERRNSMTKTEKPPNPPLHERRPSGTLSFFGGGSIGGGILGMGGGASSSAAGTKDPNSRSFGSGSSFGSTAEAPIAGLGSGVSSFGFTSWGSGGAGTGSGTITSNAPERRPSTNDGSFVPSDPIEPQLQYSIVISCHCSHSESRLHFRHPLAWRPRPSRELLLSVALEDDASSQLDKPSNDALFSPQVVTVRATNLTASEVTLTLVAPSSLIAAFSPLSLLAPPQSPHRTPRISFAQEEIFRRRSLAAAQRESARSTVSDNGSSGESLPPIHRIESLIGKSIPVVVKERVASAADMVGDNSMQRTHLWLQSVVPLGAVPPHSTTVVRCSLLPLTDGIITLDTIHIATKKQDMLYIPERPLQVFCDTKLAPPAYPIPV